MIRALKEKGLFQSLAEPNLIAYNGQEASFLAGGELANRCADYPQLLLLWILGRRQQRFQRLFCA